MSLRAFCLYVLVQQTTESKPQPLRPLSYGRSVGLDTGSVAWDSFSGIEAFGVEGSGGGIASHERDGKATSVLKDGSMDVCITAATKRMFLLEFLHYPSYFLLIGYHLEISSIVAAQTWAPVPFHLPFPSCPPAFVSLDPSLGSSGAFAMTPSNCDHKPST